MKIPKKSFPTKEKEDALFNEIAIESNFSSLQPVRDIYFAMLRVMLNRLKKNENVYLPQWGEFMLRHRKPGKVLHKDTGQIVSFGETVYVYFRPFYKLRHYFRGKKD